MSRLRVVLTERARREVIRAEGWWRANRTLAPKLFLDELAATLELLANLPASGLAAPSRRYPGVRRRLMPRTRYHVYYTVDDADGVVIVRSLWQGQRGRRPRLR